MKCNESFTNGYDLFGVGFEFGGIPTTFLTYFGLWCFSMLIFCLSRDSCMTLMTNTCGANCAKIFKPFSRPEEHHLDDRGGEDAEAGPGQCIDDRCSIVIPRDGHETDRLLRIRKEETKRLRAKSTRSMFFTEDIMRKLAGPDGVQYLRFQKCLLQLVTLTMIASCLLLSVNMTGAQYPDTVDNRLARTTIFNREPDDSLLYLHTFLSFLLFPVAVYVMRQFSGGLDFQDAPVEVTHTLQIERIPHHMCNVCYMKRHFVEAYPELLAEEDAVAAVTFAYNVSELSKKAEELRAAHEAMQYCQDYEEKNPGKTLKMKPYFCSRWFFWICCFEETIGVRQYYAKEIIRLEHEVRRHRETALFQPLGIAFVTFKSINSSKSIYDDFSSTCCNKSDPASSSLSRSLRPEKWRVSYASTPRDIHWANLQATRFWLTVKKIASNILLLLLGIFFSTPEVITEYLESYYREAGEVPAILKTFVLPLISMGHLFFLPVLISWSVRWLGYWTRSVENHQVMTRTTWFLWFSLLFAPTFGITSGHALIAHYYPKLVNLVNSEEDAESEAGGVRWVCIGLPDSGAMFAKFVIAYALLGTSIELLRFQDLALFAWYACLSKTEAENNTINRQMRAYEFMMGEQYARLLLIFSIVITFGFSTPLITPFGFLYFLLKYFVDKHNLAWVYTPTQINHDVHASAINFVIFSFVFQQFYLTLSSVVRNWGDHMSFSNFMSDWSWRSGISFILFTLSGCYSLCHAYHHFCMKIGLFKYKDLPLPEDERDKREGDYVPHYLEAVGQHEFDLTQCELPHPTTRLHQ